MACLLQLIAIGVLIFFQVSASSCSSDSSTRTEIYPWEKLISDHLVEIRNFWDDNFLQRKRPPSKDIWCDTTTSFGSRNEIPWRDLLVSRYSIRVFLPFVLDRNFSLAGSSSRVTLSSWLLCLISLKTLLQWNSNEFSQRWRIRWHRVIRSCVGCRRSSGRW